MKKSKGSIGSLPATAKTRRKRAEAKSRKSGGSRTAGETQARQLATLGEITNAITASLDLKEMLKIIVRETKKVIKFDRASIDLVDSSGEVNIVYFLDPPLQDKVAHPRTFPMKGTGIEWVIKNNKVLNKDSKHVRRFLEDDYIDQTGVKSGIVVPLNYHGKVIGTFNLGSREKNAYSCGHEEILQHIAGHIAIALENARIYKALKEQTRNLETIVDDRTKKLQKSIENLQATQVKLIQTEKLAATSKLVAGVAHEVKNPLSSIVFAIAIIEKAFEAGTDFAQTRKYCRESISILKSESTRLRNLVDRFIAFGHPTATVREKADLNEVLRQVIQSMKWKLKEKKIQLVETYCDELPEVNIDKDEFHRAFFNIIMNSLDAVQPRGKIGVKSALEDRQITIEFKDNGCGIRPDIQDKIFDIFFTTKDHGSGMGMAQVYRTVESHYGSICLSSKVGKGTKLQIELPIPDRK